MKERTIEKIMENYPYLIKFQGIGQNVKDEYAKNLMEKGQLYFQSVETYIKLELEQNKKGQGDAREVNLLWNTVRVGLERPVYCMYSVKNEDVIDQTRIIINNKVVKDFCENDGFLTICKTMDFINQFISVWDSECNMGRVCYMLRNFEKDQQIFTDGGAHFYKDPWFSYQNEFRIVLDKVLDREDVPYEETPNINPYFIEKGLHCKRYKPFILEIGNISKFSKQFSKCDLRSFDETHVYIDI